MKFLVRQRGIKNIFFIDSGNALIVTDELMELLDDYPRLFINNMTAFRSYAVKAGLSPNDWQQIDPLWDEEFELEKETV